MSLASFQISSICNKLLCFLTLPILSQNSELISAKMSSLEIKSKEHLALFSYLDTIARMLGWFLHLTIAFRIGSLIFSVKESQFSLKFFTVLTKKLLSSFATLLQFSSKESFSSVRLILCKILNFFLTRACWFFRNFC